MDHIDRKIMDILQQNARAPLKEIADRVFLSSPAVSARITRLEREGVLSGYQAQIDAPRAGYTVKAFINLDMDPQRKPEFYPYIQGCPHVVECNCVTGDYSMLIDLFIRVCALTSLILGVVYGFRAKRESIVSTIEISSVPGSQSYEQPSYTNSPYGNSDTHNPSV